ncbi:MAG: hypothetical protein UW86_C0003G0025 [Microgenomates group bacterium GW2011_GWA1_Microgenomates_45_10]|nr:MAG: hypothetical protein UW69_C0068G0009 [Microgenomates group bacterium GW2011_GWA2_44_7]KKT77657.1 MAG: hypothetical protein UW73_C0015G0025 [Microgenomates group bacterium GW2011_GWB1_44_8]KKT87380.1 MAG: hypothetical protein UW86_C0003G0025 [Microgenomates group bacterium GW2011_GWA1_Microgenomates_45_10]
MSSSPEDKNRQAEVGKKVASSLPRDASGHFMKRSASPLSGLGVSTKVEGLGAQIKKIKSATTGLTELKKNLTLDEPLVSFQVNNPFAKVIKWIDQIRRKQTTTFALKVSIPLVALPLVLFSFFQIGKVRALNQETYLSRTGFLRVSKDNPSRYLLLQTSGQVITLEVPKDFDPINLANRQVLVTGYLNQASSTMRIETSDSVELTLNTLPGTKKQK